MELEVESVEKEVGRFYADILCKETTSDRYVVVENQIERTNHDHLGKTITYAAGLGATAIVWIAKHFAEEHRAALDWLNEITNADVAFFGLEIEAWRIGDSPAAPKFNVVCRPNDFNRGRGAARRGSARHVRRSSSSGLPSRSTWRRSSSHQVRQARAQYLDEPPNRALWRLDGLDSVDMGQRAEQDHRRVARRAVHRQRRTRSRPWQPLNASGGHRGQAAGARSRGADLVQQGRRARLQDLRPRKPARCSIATIGPSTASGCERDSRRSTPCSGRSSPRSQTSG